MTHAEPVHIFDNSIKLKTKHLLDLQLERYATHNLHEPYEEGFFLQLLASAKPGVKFADIGAGVGYYTILAKLTDPSAEVFCFEPLPAHAAAIQEHLALNGVAGGVRIISEAVTDSVGNSGFFEHHYGSRLLARDQAASSTVATTTLARVIDEISGPLDIVKVDVQGEELNVLAGAADVFSSIRSWVIGTHGDEIHQQCVERLKSAGYRILCDEREPPHQPDGLVVACVDPGSDLASRS